MDGEGTVEDLKQVYCEKRTYSQKLDNHKHGYGQFLFPLQGSMDIQTDHQTLKLDDQHCLFLPSQCNHKFKSLDRNEFLVLDIPTRYLSGDHQNEESSGVYLNLDEQWSSLRFLLLEEVNHQNGSPAAVSHLVQYMSQKLNQRAYPSITYLHTHYQEQLTIEELAQLEHYHPAYYSSWFKTKTGKTPVEYVHTLRLQEAKRLLQETRWSIASISQEVGYEHSSSLTRLFLRYEGMTPKAYRNSFK